MTLDQTISLTPSQWFCGNPIYEGHGRADFEEPSGFIEGPTVVRFDESGAADVQMTVDNFATDHELQFGLMEFLSGDKPITGPGFVELPLTFTSNRCVKLVVKTVEGEFLSTEGIHHNRDQEKLTFHLLRSQFKSSDEASARYWVLPLANFISDFKQSHPELDRHPLRIYPTPVAQEQSTERDTFIARLRANAKNRLIGFEFNGGLVFVEPLVNYDTRTDNLICGRERYALTSVMVGEVSGKSLEFEDLDDWLPSEFLRILSVATGTVVGAPWIEFRNDCGVLIKRLHAARDMSAFAKGRRAIQEGIHTGVGHMLTRYASGSDRGKPYLRVVLKHLIQAGLDGDSIEDSFVYLCRAFDGLCQHYGLKQQNLIKELDVTYQDMVKAKLSEVANELKQLSRTAASSRRYADSGILERIAERTRSTPFEKDRHFGIAVTDLLKRFNLPDSDIVDAHYRKNPRSDGRTTWGAVLSYYRGAPTHEGYFNFSGKEHDASDILTVMFHLRDVLLRIVFQIVGYDGTYQPPVIRWTIDAKSDWVRPETPAAELGYS